METDFHFYLMNWKGVLIILHSIFWIANSLNQLQSEINVACRDQYYLKFLTNYSHGGLLLSTKNKYQNSSLFFLRAGLGIKINIYFSKSVWTVDYNCRFLIVCNAHFELELYTSIMQLLELFHSCDSCLLICVTAVSPEDPALTVLQTALSSGVFLPCMNCCWIKTYSG